MEHFLEFLHHAAIDTLPLLPWLFIMYGIMQLLENKSALKNAGKFGGKLGPLFGSATGLIPQCGFSVMAAKFFEKKYITVGTLLAIFFATSDEAFIILFSSGAGAVWVLPTLLFKIAIGVAVGYGADGIMRLARRRQVCIQIPKSDESEPTTTHEIFIQQYLREKEVDVVCSCGRAHGEGNAWKKYLLFPLWHALQVAAFIFLVNFALTGIIHSVGEDAFVSFMHRNRFIQPFITCAIGLIPNCASSVVLTEAFLGGGIAFGSFAAGLCANAGMGFVVLLKNVRKWRRNLTLLAVSYFLPVAIGVLCNVYPIVA